MHDTRFDDSHLTDEERFEHARIIDVWDIDELLAVVEQIEARTGTES